MRRLGFAALVMTSMLGCQSSETPTASEEQKKTFSGGPMPPEFRQKFEAMQKEGAAKPAKP